jgi:uridine monophosphate synthetase
LSTFNEKLQRAVTRTDSLLCVGLDPEARRMPERFHSAADPLLAWNLAIIEGTRTFACAYKPNIAFYEALGRHGFDLLQATLAAIPPETPVILDAKRGDIGSTAEAYAETVYDIWRADAVTVSPYLGGDSLEPFVRRPDKGVFVLCHTSNPGAGELQGLRVSAADGQRGRPLYQVVAEQARAWATHGNVGLIVGATYPDPLRIVRSIAPDMWILAPGVGAQGGSLEATLAAGLTGAGDGLLINVSRGLAQADDITAAAGELVRVIRAARRAQPRAAVGGPADPAGNPGSSPDSRVSADVETLALALHTTGCVQFGDFTLHSGQQSPIYIDLRLLVSDPATLRQASTAYCALLGPLAFDRIAGIPYAALPIATAVGLALDKPILYPRKDIKGYGTGRTIEGHYRAGETVVVLDDLVTTGDSKVTAIAPLEAAGLEVRDIVVLIDREQGGAQQLAQRGYRLHSVLGIRRLLDILCRHGRITTEQQAEVLAFLGRK